MRARRSPEGVSASISACISLRHLGPSLVPQMPRKECRVRRISASRCRSPSNGAAASWARAGPAWHAEMRMRAARNCLNMKGIRDVRDMPSQCAGSKARGGPGHEPESAQEHATRGLDDLKEASGDLEIA